MNCLKNRKQCSIGSFKQRQPRANLHQIMLMSFYHVITSFKKSEIDQQLGAMDASLTCEDEQA